MPTNPTERAGTTSANRYETAPQLHSRLVVANGPHQGCGKLDASKRREKSLNSMRKCGGWSDILIGCTSSLSSGYENRRSETPYDSFCMTRSTQFFTWGVECIHAADGATVGLNTHSWTSYGAVLLAQAGDAKVDRWRSSVLGGLRRAEEEAILISNIVM